MLQDLNQTLANRLSLIPVRLKLTVIRVSTFLTVVSVKNAGKFGPCSHEKVMRFVFL